MDSSLNRRLVILGGGAAGILLAMKLASDKQKLGIDITLIDCKPFFEYTPSLISVLYEASDEQFERHFCNITADYETLLGGLGVKFELGIVRDMDNENVILGDGSQKIAYDILVICTGSFYHDPWKVPCQQDRTTMQWQDRLDYLRTHRDKYKSSEDIMCIGGGPVGVEVASEIAWRAPLKHVTLVSSSDTVLSGTPGGVADGAGRILNHLDPIRLLTGEKAEKVDDADDSTYKTDKTNTEIKTDLVYLCTGIRPNTQFLQKSHPNWLDDKKRIRVNEYFQVRGDDSSGGEGNTSNNSKSVFAVGDVNDVNEPKLWFTAHMQTVHLYHNLKRFVEGKNDMVPYSGSQISMVISLGPHYAVGSFNGFVLNGWPFGRNSGSKLAAIAKHTVERVTMNDFHSKKLANDILYQTHEKGHLFQKITGTCLSQR
ncbi:hypothetical protein BDB00DRAFT_853369 [Zychaea mexicana]|uniref:uncharacterized protein n=1 Tax=Zychaea mexicana TaxID=64656 RepID=UPI0022FEE376|nr:uncharacterized protein BDB00DRAFT_853369 [Zychaea mexicana]KAI9484806.1 hypothetical protein BDB00DRAFT_853369 [Zychaea mexicana]